MPDVDRTLPHNLEAETMVLGACLLHQSVWPEVAAVLTAGDFYRDANRRIFAAMGRLADETVIIDYVTLKEELGSELEAVGGPAYIISLTDGMPHSTNAKHYCQIIREKSLLRQAIITSNKVIAEAYDAEMKSAEIVEAAVRDLSRLCDRYKRESVRIKAAVDEYMNAVVNEKMPEPVPTGYVEVDELLGGFNRGDLTLIAARPSVGKSSLALGIAHRMALRGTSVAFFPLEMRKDALAAQVIAWRARVSSNSVRLKKAEPQEYERLAKAWSEMTDLPLHLETAHTLTEVMAAARRLKETDGLQCAFVDYIQLMTPEGKHESRQTEVANMSRTLKRFAGDAEIAVVGLSQLKRPQDGKRKKQDVRPQLSELRESGALEQDADLAVLLYRPEMHNKTEENEGVAEFIVAKNRYGPTGIVKLYFDKDLAEFRDFVSMSV